jgi:hypothetical protein
MVDAICTVIKPELRKDDDGNKVARPKDGDRVAMLKSLKDVVSAAKDELIAIKRGGVFEYGNWWIEAFIQLGEDSAGKFPDHKRSHKFTVEEELDETDQKQVSRIRKAHARAAAASLELTDEAWEQLCDEFVPLAKCSEMRNFFSSDDYQRTAQICNVHVGLQIEVLSIQTPISTVTVDPKTSITLHCPDAITPIQVRVSPPFFHDEAWLTALKDGQKTFQQYMRLIINANQTIVYEIFPGVTYYWFRDDVKGSHMIITEEELLARGRSVIINELSQSVTFNPIEGTEFLSIPGHSARVVEYGEKGKLLGSHLIEPGKKYYVYHPGHVSPVSGPQIVSAEDKRDRESRERGSIVMSASGSYRRIHEWQKTREEKILNGVTPKFADYCLDQFWIFVQTSPPTYPSSSYAPDQVTYLIVNKSSKSRLFATVSSESGRDGFGFAKGDQKVEDSHKWQFEIANPEADTQDWNYHIVNVLSDRRLGLESDGNGTTETRIVATIPEEYYALSSSFEGGDYESRHCWKPLPWETLKDIASSYNLPAPRHILSRETLPSNELLKEGGIIVENACPILVTLYWEKGGARTKYYLRPGSQVYMKWPKDEQPVGDVNICVERNGSPVKRSVKPGQKHRIVFPAENPLCEGTPDVIPINDDGNEGTGKSPRGCLIVRVPISPDETVWVLWYNRNFGYLNSTETGEKFSERNQVFDIELMGGRQYRMMTGDGTVVSKYNLENDYVLPDLKVDPPVEMAVITALTFGSTINRASTFPRVGEGGVSVSEATHIIEPVANSGGSFPICTIKNKSTETYLCVGEERSFTPGWYKSNLSYGKTADRWAIIPVGMVNTEEGKAHLRAEHDVIIGDTATSPL